MALLIRFTQLKWLPSDPGIFPSTTIVLLELCYDPILLELKWRHLDASGVE